MAYGTTSAAPSAPATSTPSKKVLIGATLLLVACAALVSQHSPAVVLMTSTQTKFATSTKECLLAKLDAEKAKMADAAGGKADYVAAPTNVAIEDNTFADISTASARVVALTKFLSAMQTVEGTLLHDKSWEHSADQAPGPDSNDDVAAEKATALIADYKLHAGSLFDGCFANDCPVGKGLVHGHHDNSCQTCTDGKFNANIDDSPCVPHTITQCIVGGEEFTEGTGSTDGSCTPCSDGEFVDEDTVMGDVHHGKCQAHTITSCAGGHFLSPGNKVRDGECEACPNGQYKAGHNAHVACTSYQVTSCPAGSGFSAGTDTHDGSCTTCAQGTYSAHHDSGGCTPHTVTSCGANYVFTAGTTTSDGFCTYSPPANDFVYVQAGTFGANAGYPSGSTSWTSSYCPSHHPNHVQHACGSHAEAAVRYGNNPQWGPYTSDKLLAHQQSSDHCWCCCNCNNVWVKCSN